MKQPLMLTKKNSLFIHLFFRGWLSCTSLSNPRQCNNTVLNTSFSRIQLFSNSAQSKLLRVANPIFSNYPLTGMKYAPELPSFKQIAIIILPSVEFTLIFNIHYWIKCYKYCNLNNPILPFLICLN